MTCSWTRSAPRGDTGGRMNVLKQLASGHAHARFLDLGLLRGLHRRALHGPGGLPPGQAAGSGSLYQGGDGCGGTTLSVIADVKKYSDIDLGREFRSMEQSLPTPREEQVRTILKSIDKEPPHHNLDCGACGYPTCRDKAVAVAQGMVEAEYCLPYLLAESKKIFQQLEKSHRELQLFPPGAGAGPVAAHTDGEARLPRAARRRGRPRDQQPSGHDHDLCPRAVEEPGA